MAAFERLMYVSEYRCPDFAGPRNKAQKLFAVFEADLVKPLAADGQGRVMQANQYVLGGRRFEHGLQPFHFMIIDTTGCVIANATINAGDQPGAIYDRRTVMKLGTGKRIFHHIAIIVIAGHAIHGESERKH